MHSTTTRGFLCRLFLCSVFANLFIAGTFAAPLTESKLYWTDLNNDNVKRSNLDGGNVEQLFTTSVPTYLATSPSTGKIYYAVGFDIFGADLNGGNRQLIRSFDSHSFVRGLSVDASGQNLYWTSSDGYTAGNGQVRTMNVSGANLVDLASLAERYPYGMSLDGNGHLYWLDTVDTPQIERMNLDGSGRTTLINGNVGFNGQLAVGFDKIFWLDAASALVRSADLNGSNIQTVSTLGGIAYDGGITIDPIGQKLYWADTWLDSIFMSNFDGSGKTTIYATPGLYAMGLSVASVPEPSTNVLAAIGIGACCVAAFRTRRKVVA